MSGRMPLTDAAHVRMSMLEFLLAPIASHRAAGIVIGRIVRAAIKFDVAIDAWLGAVWAADNVPRMTRSNRCGITVARADRPMFKCARTRGHDGECKPRKRRKER